MFRLFVNGETIFHTGVATVSLWLPALSGTVDVPAALHTLNFNTPFRIFLCD